MSQPTAFFVFLVAAASASAQVTLSTVQGGTATPTAQVYSFGSVALGGASDTEFRLTNAGSAAVYLTNLNVGGPLPSPYFSVLCPLSPDLCGGSAYPELPIQIEPSGTLDFTVQFEPLQLGSTSAPMTIDAGNTISTFLTGTGVAGLTALWSNQPLGAGETVTFGAVQVGSSQTIALALSNQTGSPVVVPAIPALPGGPFSLAGIALSGPTVAPGSSVELDVVFSPTATGPQQATLTIGLLTYPLAGTGAPSALAIYPAASIQLTPATLASAQQASLSVSLASASTIAGKGTVTLSGLDGDPVVTFADGTRTAVFTVAAGESVCRFSDAPNVSFGTGTTAGNLTFTVALGANSPVSTTASIAAASVGIDAAVAARNVGCDPSLIYCAAVNVELQINGWDNTRSASQLIFSFFDSSGAAIAPGEITLDAASAFQAYFGASDMAGVFGVTALFPITGDSYKVTAATVRIVNVAGSVQSAGVTF